MQDPHLFPKLRWPIEVRIERAKEQEVLVLRCPVGVADAPLALVPAVLPILSCFDGSLSVQQIAEKFDAYGIKIELIEQLVKILDDHFFLHSPRFFAAEKRVKEEFLSALVRPAALAGFSYAANPEQLVEEIRRYVEGEKPPLRAINGPLLGLVSPHIDYRRGSASYAKAYNHLQYEQHDLYIVMGTSHQYSTNIFHLTLKDFASPLGVIPCDIDFVKRLAMLYGFERSFGEEIVHRKEHSLELQLPFLQHFVAKPRIVPVLVGSFHHMLGASRGPASFDEYENFVASLAECVRVRIGQGQKVLFVAGVDMAHIGQAFGDKEALNVQRLKAVDSRDQIYLEIISAQDKQRLLEHIAEDSDARRICGFPTLYTIIDVFDRLGWRYDARLFDYRQAVDYESDCAVTFAGMGLYAKS